MVHMQIEAVRVVGRHRKDLGDLDALAKSIASAGLINPITVTSDGQLIAGQRRLEACRLLGWDMIPCIVADDLDTATDRLVAERDENTERKAMKPSELVSLGKALEELERPKAEKRKGAGQFGSRRATGTVHSDSHQSKGDTNEKVAEALGVSGSTYDRAKFVVDTAANPDVTEQERSNAQEALAQMDATGKVQPAYDKVRAKTDRPRIGSPRTPPPKPKIATAKQQRNAINAAVTKMSAIAYGLGQIEKIHEHITSNEAAQWVDGLAESRRTITQLISLLKEHANA